MILMLETNPFKSEKFRRADGFIKALTQLYGIDFKCFPLCKIHDALQDCRWIKRKPAPYTLKNGTSKESTVYEFGEVGKLVNANNIWTPDYYEDYVKLGSALEKHLGIKILQDAEKDYDEEENNGEEEPWPDINAPYKDGEAKMDNCNQELIQRYQTEGKRKIKITESQIRKLKQLLNNN